MMPFPLNVNRLPGMRLNYRRGFMIDAVSWTMTDTGYLPVEAGGRDFTNGQLMGKPSTAAPDRKWLPGAPVSLNL